jgi:predicted nucleotidyltransferase component of viral defense system
MIFSKQQLQREANLTGFKMEHLEKVFLLMNLLSDFATFPQLKDKLALKGGTALNLFIFDLPRLSVDIDLNYIGNIDRNAMLIERPQIQSTITAICERNGLMLDRNPNRHAGGKMIWRYPSSLGQMGNLEIDLNFMFRVPLWPVELKSSCIVGSQQIHNIPVLNVHELSAGKLAALIDRKTGRDIFDAYHLLTELELDNKKLRLALIIYTAISRKVDLRKLTPHDINVNLDDLRKRLVPLLKKDAINECSLSIWTENLVKQCQKAFMRLLPLTGDENEFLNRLLNNGKIEPELITNDSKLIENIKLHPAIRWSAQNSKNQI